MKIFFVSISLLFSTFVFAQTKIEVDTILVNFRLQGIVDITSHIPQIIGEIDPVIKDKINADIKGYFMADIQDSAAYVSDLLENYGVTTLDDYFKELEEYGPGDEDESFELTYITDDLLNFTYSYSIRPYMGQYQFFFWSVIYDLRTGNKLNFNEFFTIDRETFISIFQKKGYYVSWLNGSVPFEILPAIDYYGDVEENINTLFPNDTIEAHNCIEFYFQKRDSTTHLMLKLLCAGPYLQDYGIALVDLLPYIKYYTFKNEFKLWGNDIGVIRGQDYNSLGDKITLDSFSIFKSESSYMFAKDERFPSADFGIATWYSQTSFFYLFLKYENSTDQNKITMLDILEIKKADVTGEQKLAEQCEIKTGNDAEVFAIVKSSGKKSEYYVNIIKAWRANRQTEKFEFLDKKKVRKCGN